MPLIGAKDLHFVLELRGKANADSSPRKAGQNDGVTAPGEVKRKANADSSPPKAGSEWRGQGAGPARKKSQCRFFAPKSGAQNDGAGKWLQEDPTGRSDPVG